MSFAARHVGHYSIWIVSPADYPHSRCFEEVALGLGAAFRALGHEVALVIDPARARGVTIALGAHLLPLLPGVAPPEPLILYNLEQVHDASSWLQPAYLDLLRRHPVWDYSPRNLAALRELGIGQAALCGIGYVPELERIPAAPEQDIDVLFVGSFNERRRRVLDALVAAGCRVTARFGVYGQERDALYARARIVLNVHYHPARVFEIVRVSYLLANRVCVVSESGSDPELERPLASGVTFVPYEALVAACLALLAAADRRRVLAEAGFRAFSALAQTQMLERALAMKLG